MRHASQRVRRTRTKGMWMQLRDPELLTKYMTAADFTGARLARSVGCSRQFISKLVNGQTRTCTNELGLRIEEALRVHRHTLFMPKKSTTGRPTAPRKGTAA